MSLVYLSPSTTSCWLQQFLWPQHLYNASGRLAHAVCSSPCVVLGSNVIEYPTVIYVRVEWEAVTYNALGFFALVIIATNTYLGYGYMLDVVKRLLLVSLRSPWIRTQDCLVYRASCNSFQWVGGRYMVVFQVVKKCTCVCILSSGIPLCRKPSSINKSIPGTNRVVGRKPEVTGQLCDLPLLLRLRRHSHSYLCYLSYNCLPTSFVYEIAILYCLTDNRFVKHYVHTVTN